MFYSFMGSFDLIRWVRVLF